MKHWQAVTTHGDIVTMTFLCHQDAKGVVSVSGERCPVAGASGTAWATVSWCLPALKAPLFLCSPSLPALDWQLPSHSGPYELRIEVQPKSHHRAHYETEGSRGAVKASAGGHPVVQVWRLLWPAKSPCLGISQSKTVFGSTARDFPQTLNTITSELVN